MQRSPAQGQEQFQHLRAELARAVHSALKRLAAKATNVQAQQAAAEKAEATRKQADLLTANLHRCQPGAAVMEACLPSCSAPV